MATNRRGIVIEIVGDERSYLRAVEGALASNTKLDASFRRVGVTAKASAQAQVAAALKARRAMRANVAALSAEAAAAPVGSERQLAALALAEDAQRKLARSYGATTVAGGRLSSSSKEVERDLGKATRGALAGTGIFRGLGRSVAFASGTFLGFTALSDVLRGSIEGAESLEKAQRGLDAAIQHTGGSVEKLIPKYTATATAAAKFGINQADATTALERATVLTGDADKAQRAYTEALVISKATGKDFNSVLTATAKGQEGVTTSLQRYGILIPKNTAGQRQYNQVMARFAGQARANTSQSERLNAAFSNTEEIIGTALLPILNKYLGRLANWLEKMQRSGKLQRDVNTVVRDATTVVHDLSAAIRFVNRVTGGWKNTLAALVALRLASRLNRWTGALDLLTGAKGAGGILGAEAASARLLTKLRALAGLGVISVEVVLFEHFIRRYGLKNTLRAGLDPISSLGPDVADDQTIVVKGKRYVIGTSAAYTALIKAGAKFPNDHPTARQEIIAARKLGGSASIPPPPPQHHHHHHRHHHLHRIAPGVAAGPAAPARSIPLRAPRSPARTLAVPAGVTKTLVESLNVERQIRGNTAKTVDRLTAILKVDREIHTRLRHIAGRATHAGRSTGDQSGDFRSLLPRRRWQRWLEAPPGAVGAYGYIIDPSTSRPIVIHHHTHLDGREIERSTTRHQQRRRRRNPPQRRGPNAGTATA